MKHLAFSHIWEFMPNDWFDFKKGFSLLLILPDAWKMSAVELAG